MEPLTKDQEEQQSLLAVLSQALQQSNFDSLNAVNELNQAILSCLQHVITGSLRTSDFIRVVREIMPENDSSWVTNGILSSLWILASQVSHHTISFSSFYLD